MGDVGEDLASKLRRVLYQHQVELETAKSTTTSEDNSSSDSSNDPTLSYISRMLLDDASDEDDEVGQSSPEQYQVMMDELTTIIDSPTSEVGVEYGFVSGSSGAVDYHWALMQCARAVATGNNAAFFSLVAELRRLISQSPVPNVYERMVMFFIDALTARLTGTGAQAYRAMAASLSTRRLLSMRMLNLPGFTITQQFGNEVILRECKGATRVHIVDYGIHCGFQWPAVIKAFSERPEGAPQLRITGIELHSEIEASQTGQRLTQYANSCGLNLVFTLVSTSSWETVQPKLHPGETLIINCNLREGNIKDDFMAMNSPRSLLLERIRKMQPKIFVQCCCSVALSTPFFQPRFEEALNYMTCKLEYSETWLGDKPEWRDLMEKTIAKNIMNVVGCEGVDWDFRPESYRTWDSRAKRAGLVQVPLDDEIYNKVKLVWGGYKNTSEHFCCGRDENWMLVGWRNRVLTGMCAWRPRNIK